MDKKQLTQREYNEINEVESWLYKYKSIKIAIENLKMEYEEIKDVSLGSADPSKETIITNKFNSNVENAIEKKEYLASKIQYMENKIIKLDRALSSLNDEEYKVIYNYFICGKHYFEFCHEMFCSERKCKSIKKRSIEKLRIAMYGI